LASLPDIFAFLLRNSLLNSNNEYLSYTILICFQVTGTLLTGSQKCQMLTVTLSYC